MIVLIGGEKGGCGKTTIATNLATCLAAAGRDVLLLDADRQGTAANWASERGERPELPAVQCVQRFGNLFQPIRDLAQRYQDVVIDAGGRDSEELRTAMVAADAMFSPLRASQADLWTAEHVDQLVGLAKSFNPALRAFVFLTMAPTNPRITEAADATEMLGEFQHLAVATSVVRDRKAYRDAMCEGKGAIELADPKAAAEIHALTAEVLSHEQVQSSEAPIH
ncbi:MAG: AAA family ATPase [Myxococcales bacterium]|nr:AAA family ATPase [Myxococcales bacterium]